MRVFLPAFYLFASLAATSASPLGGNTDDVVYVALPNNATSCGSAGLLYIESEDECNAAASAAHLNLTTAEMDSDGGAVDLLTLLTTATYGCSYNYNNASEGGRLSFTADAGKGTTVDGVGAICKKATKPDLKYPAVGWVALNNFLTLETNGFRDDADGLFAPKPLTPSLLRYAALQILPAVTITLILFYPVFLLVGTLACLAVVICFVFPWKLVTAGFQTACQSVAAHVTTILQWVVKHLMRSLFRDMFTSHDSSNFSKTATHTGWAAKKAKKLSGMTQIGAVLLIPLVVVQIAVLDSEQYNLVGEDLVVAPCASGFFNHDDDGGVGDGSGSSDGNATDDGGDASSSLKIRHEGICQAVADGWDCFVMNVKNETTSSIGTALEMNRTSVDPLACSPDGFFDLVDTCDAPEIINCFKIHDQTPMAWLDGLGIATGVIGLLVYIFSQLDWLFRIGKEEPDSTRPTCCMSIRHMRNLFCYVGLMCLGVIEGFSLLSLLKLAKSGAFSTALEDIYASYFIPVLFIVLWMFVCVNHVGDFDAGTCRYAILMKLFESYAVDGKHWTPKSTALLLEHVKASISFPDRDEAVQLDGYELAHYMTDGEERRTAQKKKDKAAQQIRRQLMLTQLQNGNDIAISIMAETAGEDAETDPAVVQIKKELAAVRNLFDSVDANADGKVSKEELAAELKTADSTLKVQLEDAGISTTFYVLEQLDANEDGWISFDEFAAVMNDARVEYKWTVDRQNRGIFAFVCAIKRMPAKLEAYRNPKSPVGSLAFGEVWEATWDSILTDADLKKNKTGQHWWELGVAEEPEQKQSSGKRLAANIGFSESDDERDGGDNVQF